jgi:uncharacterized membrane protein
VNAPTSDDKLWAGLSYVGIGCCMIGTIVIFLLKKGESDYIKFHSLQAIGFGVVLIVLYFLFGILSSIPVVGLLASIPMILLMLGSFGYWIYLMIQAFTGKDVRIPVLADWIEQNLMNR